MFKDELSFLFIAKEKTQLNETQIWIRIEKFASLTDNND